MTRHEPPQASPQNRWDSWRFPCDPHVARPVHMRRVLVSQPQLNIETGNTGLDPIFWGGSGLDCSLNSNISLESCGFWNWKTHLAPSFLCNSVGAEKTAIREDLKASSRCTSACRQVPLRVAAGVKLDGKSCHKQYLWYFCGILWYFVVIWYMSNISYL